MVSLHCKFCYGPSKAISQQVHKFPALVTESAILIDFIAPHCFWCDWCWRCYLTTSLFMWNNWKSSFALLFIAYDASHATNATWQPALFIWKNWNPCVCKAFALLFIASGATDDTDATWQQTLFIWKIRSHAVAWLLHCVSSSLMPLMLPDNQPYSSEKMEYMLVQSYRIALDCFWCYWCYRCYLTTSHIHLQKLKLMRVHCVSQLLKLLMLLMLHDNQSYSSEKVGTHAFAWLLHNISLLLMRLMLPMLPLTTNPIHLKRLELPPNYYE